MEIGAQRESPMGRSAGDSRSRYVEYARLAQYQSYVQCYESFDQLGQAPPSQGGFFFSYWVVDIRFNMLYKRAKKTQYACIWAESAKQLQKTFDKF